MTSIRITDPQNPEYSRTIDSSQVIEIIEDNNVNAVPDREANNYPLMDEICITSQDNSHHYIVRLLSKNTLSESLLKGKHVEFIDDSDNPTPAIQAGSIRWVADEDVRSAAVKLKIFEGHLLEDGSTQMHTSNGTASQKVRDSVIKALGLEEFIDDSGTITVNQNNWPAIYQKLQQLEKTLDGQVLFVGKAPLRWTTLQGKDAIDLQILITPTPEDVSISFSPIKDAAQEKTQKELVKIISGRDPLENETEQTRYKTDTLSPKKVQDIAQQLHHYFTSHPSLELGLSHADQLTQNDLALLHSFGLVRHDNRLNLAQVYAALTKIGETEDINAQREMRDVVYKALGITLSDKGSYEWHFNLVALPKDIQIRTPVLNDQGEKTGEEIRNLSSPKWDHALHPPYNQKNLEKALEAIQDDYDQKGFLTQIVYVEQKDGVPLYEIKLHRAPKIKGPQDIVIEGQSDPLPLSVRKAFIDERTNGITNRSFKEGQTALAQWLQEKGYILRKGEPGLGINENQLVIILHAAKVAGLKVQYITDENRVSQMPEQQAQNVTREFQPRGQFFNIRDYYKDLSRIKANYPLGLLTAKDAKGPIKIGEPFIHNQDTDEITLTPTLKDITPQFSLRLGAGVKMNQDNDVVGGNGDFGFSWYFKDGKTISIDMSASGDSKSFFGSSALSLKLPWIDELGSTLTLGTQYALYHYANASDDHLVAASALYDRPFQLRSPWHLLVGGGVQLEINTDSGLTQTWVKPDVGLSYSDDSTLFVVQGGPRFEVTHQGYAYSQVDVLASERFHLGNQWNLALDAQFGGKIGDIDYTQAYRPMDTIANFGGLDVNPTNVHATLRLRLYNEIGDLLGQPIYLGMALAASTRNHIAHSRLPQGGTDVELGVGPYLSIMGMEALVGLQLIDANNLGSDQESVTYGTLGFGFALKKTW